MIFDHQSIEQKWQKSWRADNIYGVADMVSDKENFYLLVEFPYPSGDLHVGHWYAFAVTDIIARYKRMQGYNVLFPIGFDAFGLPAENAAIKRGLDPKQWTYDNMTSMRKQIELMGTSFATDREVVTCDPTYYKWTQWLITQLFENNLMYRSTQNVNWCPSCNTVLANEQVVAGTCERCDNEVEQKEMPQWSVKITEYADRLIDDLDDLDWPESIKDSQRNWIGRSYGAQLSFVVVNNELKIDVFTTRPDTLFGATYMVLAPEHAGITELQNQIENWDEVEAYITTAGKKSDLERQENKEKTGVELKGVTAINPGTGEEIPIWIADYVLAHYGTGAIMAVPAHDERDYEFAQKFKLPIIEVIQHVEEDVFTGTGTVINSGEFDGLQSEEAKEKITESVEGTMTATYRLRDWSIGRQRYWGCPIPIVYDPEGKPHAVPKEHLPWLLPEDVDHTPDGTSPLARSQELKERTEKIFGKGWTSEVETMDTFVDSSWYYLRYADPGNTEEFVTKEAEQSWLPVDFYSGGAEHTTMHVLYSRFFHKALYDLGLVSTSEPYTTRLNRGLILGPDGNKMSKSKGNVINPDDVVAKLGADTVRTYLAFIGPYNEVGNYPWDTDGIVGVRRFLERIVRLHEKIVNDHEDSTGVIQELHKAIKKVGDEIESKKLNTSVAALMSLIKAWEKESIISSEAYLALIQLVAPFAPHLAEEMWERLGMEGSVHMSKWPDFDPKLLIASEVTIVVQVNGKVRDSFVGDPNMAQESAEKEACGLPGVQKHIQDKELIKIIYVPGKLVNIVVK